MIYNATDGSVLSVGQEFLDDDEFPVVPKAGYPKVRLLDSDKTLLSSVVASPSSTPGNWNANVSIPGMDLLEAVELTLEWRMWGSDGSKYKVTDSVKVEPKIDVRDDDVVAVFGDLRFAFSVPIRISDLTKATYQIYQDNTPLLSSPVALSDTSIIAQAGLEKTKITAPMSTVKVASLTSYLLRVTLDLGSDVPRSFTYKLWALTPSIIKAMTQLEDFLNKSRIENVIPQLRYNEGDLVEYLERGLYLFNTVSKPTSFTGLNMQGVIGDAWITCSCYYALSAQLLAEGSLSFDFSGQGISLNVDRTPALESALGRIESAIESRVVPLKNQLAVQGITGGDGSIGKTSLNNSAKFGVLGIINAPTTSLPSRSNQWAGRRY